MKNRGLWIGAGIIVAMCWPISSVVLGRRASAQVVVTPMLNYPGINPQGTLQRLGGPFIYSPGNRPMTIFSGGQFGYGFYDPMAFNPQPQAPVGYYLLPVDPNLLYTGTFANMPPGNDGDQSAGVARATGVYPIARTNDLIDAEYENGGKLRIQWQGETTAARAVHFALLDRNRTVLKQISIDELPAETRFDPNAKAAYVRTIVVYVNGTTNTTVFPLQPPAPRPGTAAPTDKTAEPAKESGDVPSNKP